MRYVEARIEERNREEAYRIFVTKSLQLIPQNKFLKIDYDEMLKKASTPQKSGDEIAAEVIKNAGLTFGE